MDYEKKDKSVKNNLKHWQYLNRLYSRLIYEADAEKVCEDLTDAVILKAEAPTLAPIEPGKPAQGFIIYIRTAAGEYKAVEVVATNDGGPELKYYTADIITNSK